DRASPGQQERSEMLRVRESESDEAPASRPQQLTLVDEVGGDEQHEQHLRRLAGLEGDGAELQPQAGSVDLAPDLREEWAEQRAYTEEERGVPVALKGADP